MERMVKAAEDEGQGANETPEVAKTE